MTKKQQILDRMSSGAELIYDNGMGRFYVREGDNREQIHARTAMALRISGAVVYDSGKSSGREDVFVLPTKQA